MFKPGLFLSFYVLTDIEFHFHLVSYLIVSDTAQFRSTGTSFQIICFCRFCFYYFGDVPYFLNVKSNALDYPAVNELLVFRRKESARQGSLLCLCLIISQFHLRYLLSNWNWYQNIFRIILIWFCLLPRISHICRRFPLVLLWRVRFFCSQWRFSTHINK